MNTFPQCRFTLAIEIGNTRAHFGIVNGETLTCEATKSVPIDSVRELLITTVLDLLEKHDKSFCSSIVISGSRRSLAEYLKNKLSDLFPDRVKIAAYTPKLPFKCNYKKPVNLGLDRIANCLYGTTMFKGKNLILISTGTAIVVDLVIDNEFIGGTISAGLQTQLQSLNKSTDALPLVSIQTDTAITLPGNSTENCIASGVVYGCAGGIERIVHEYTKLLTNNYHILGTGGDWELLRDYVNFDHQFVPDMTIIGTTLFTKYLD
jgi:pantothenate kinase type III